ncbi:MAG: peptidoglycan hydrolase CwlO-like protein [Candidatus Latescibacterota bacterium]|jgi:peptidoglycan hydrolase CwlO-like protein
MSSITQIFLGIMLVGLIMSMKVIMDGLQAVTLLKDKITALRIAIQDAKTQLLVQENENKEIEATLQEIKAEVDKLSEKEKEIDSEIKTLRTDFS